MEAFERILVRMPNWLGDVVMATPLLATLRHAQPRAHLAVLVLPSGAQVLEGLPGIDETILYRRKDEHAGLTGMVRLARDLRRRRFDLAISCPNSFSQALLLRMAGVPRRLGWAYGGRGFLLTERLVPPMRGHRRVPRPMPQYYLDLARHLGCEVLSARARLATTPAGEDEAARFLASRGVADGTPLVGLNVGASFGPSKLWNARGFAAVAAALRRSRGMRPIVLCGPGEEALGREIEDAVGGDVVRTSDCVLSINGLKALVRRLDLLVTTDTGPRHFAVAFDVPYVCVMGSTDPMMTDQPEARGEVVRREPLLDCMPCHEKVCPLVHHKCLEDLTPAQVLAAVDRVMAMPPGDGALMRAVVLDEKGLRLEPAHPDPKPRKGEAIVRVQRAGICGTDLELLHGYKGFRGVPGHEFAGTVEWCGSKQDLVGRRVVGEINVGCGACDRCRRSGPHHCERRDVLGILGRDGAFADRLSLPVRNLVPLGEDTPFEEGVFVEPLAAANHVLSQVKISAKTRAVVLGPGRLGRLVAIVLRSQTDHVTLVGRSDASPRDADVVVDCTGSPDGLLRALDVVRPRGTIVLKSTCAAEATLPASIVTRIVVDEIEVVGSRCGTSEDFQAARNSILVRTVDVRPLIEATYPLERFETAFEHAAQPGALKILLDLA